MKYSVLTYIFGGYECVHEIEHKDKDAEYILVTDDKNLRSDTWTIVVDNRKNFTIMEKCYYVRFHPFEYVHTDIVVRLDSSIGIKAPLTPFIDKMVGGNYDRCLMIHPRRNRIEAEYSVWVKNRGYSQAQADKYLDFMDSFDYPRDYEGLFQGCFEIVRKNDINQRINHCTYFLLQYYSEDGHMDRVDQTILSFVINYSFSTFIKVLPVLQDILIESPYMQWYYHNTYKPILQKSVIQPKMFNGFCKVFTP